MHYAIACKEKDIKSVVSDHFARTNFFALYNSSSKAVEFIENPHKQMPKRAGPAVTKMLASLKVEVVISSEFGERIKNLFESHKIGMIIVPDEIKNVEEIISLIENKNR